MNELVVKIKKLRSDAKIPVFKKNDDAGADAFINRFKGIREDETLYNWECDEACLSPLFRIACCLGFSTEIPRGYYFQVVPRSGLALWEGLSIVNSPGTIDSGYRGEWIAIVVNISNKGVTLKKGDRICQMIFRKKINFEFREVSELESSERGDGGFGSTGK